MNMFPTRFVQSVDLLSQKSRYATSSSSLAESIMKRSLFNEIVTSLDNEIMLNQRRQVYHRHDHPYNLHRKVHFMNPGKLRCLSTASTMSDEVTSSEVQSPLQILMKTAQSKNLCDQQGFRVPGKSWSFALSITDEIPTKPPNLRTINFQRIDIHKGIEFVMTKKGFTSQRLLSKIPVSILYVIGDYLPGQKVTQWRAEGFCDSIPLIKADDKHDVGLLGYIPEHTIAEMIASHRSSSDTNVPKTDGKRLEIDRASNFTEMVQKVRRDIENGVLSHDEINEAISAWRFVPYRMEQMIGGPDQIMWDRRQWIKDNDEDWMEPKKLVPF